MKKTYIQPTLLVVKYDLCQPMLTTSIPLSDIDTGTQLAPEIDLDEFFDGGDDLDSYFD